MINVLLIEDHASFRQAIDTVIQVEPDLQVVARVDRGDEAAETAVEFAVDVALVDLDLPGGDGVEAITAIREARPETACVVLSALSDDAMFGRAIEAGASAVLHKSVGIPQLLEVIRKAAAGQTVLPPEETSRRLKALAQSRDRDWHAQMLQQALTPRERQVLQLLARGGDNRAIARDLGISPETVQTHIRNMLSKLAVGSRLEAVVKALRLGLVDPPG